MLLHNAMFFACGSMGLTDLLCAVFPRAARKNRTPLKRAYRSAAGAARQLRKF
jgi:hypothetical protein